MSALRHGGRGRVLALAAVVFATLGLTGGRTAAAPPAPNGPVPNCTTPKSDAVQCVAVEATLDRVLVQGGTAQLSIKVDSQVDVSTATIEAVLPANLTWSAAPARFAVTRQSSAMAETGGTTETATRTLAVRAGHRVTVTGTVRATASSTSTVEVRVTGGAGHPEEVAATTVVATVGPTRSTSYLGYRPGPLSSGQLPPGTAIRRSRPDLRPKPLTPHGLPQPSPPGTVTPATIACAKGSWTYEDQHNVWHPQVNIQVQLRSRGIHGVEELLAVGLTDQNGFYQLCSPVAAHRDVWVQEVTDNGKWAVENGSGGNYVVTTPTVTNVGSGTTVDFGSRFPLNFMRAMHLFDEANDASTWLPGDCWVPADHDCKLIHIRWTPNSTDGPFYDPDNDTVHLRALHPDTSYPLHELGHAIMDDAYHDHFPSIPQSCAKAHFIPRNSGPVCAWVEGFADWFQAAVTNRPVFDYDGTNVEDLEGPTWGTGGWDNGDGVEGRIAAAMIDLTDTNNEPYWDRHSEANPGPLLQTLENHRPNTFHDFWTFRGQDGFDVGPDALAALYQNTVDYQFRDPLGNYTPLTRPAAPPSGHNYQFQTTTVFWSVVAVRPPAGTDYDLFVYDDIAQTRTVGFSLQGAGDVDFVAIDSNHQPLGSFYPRVLTVSGGKEYQIEVAQGANLLQPSEQIPMGAHDVVVVRDMCVDAAGAVTLTATPSDPAQVGELFVMASDPANANTWVQPRSGAAASAADDTPGAPASLTFNAPGGGCYGVILVNKAGAGTYTLSRS